MAYDAFNTGVPTTGGSPTPTRQETIDAIRKNLMALRDSIVMTGLLQGFNYSYTTGTAEQPTTVLYKRGTEWIKLVITWGTTGDEDGQVTKIAFYYSSNSGGVYDNMADASGNFVVTFAYATGGFMSTTTWGSTP